MEQKKLPNGVLSIVLGIFGFLCCCTGILGAISSGIGLKLALKSEKLFKGAPEEYDNFSQIKTAKIINIIALALSVLMIIRWIYIIFNAGGLGQFIEEFKEAYGQAMEQYGEQ
ncbi:MULTISPECIES: CCC motif membrane protein [Croceitalea]|uniref:CCC motif membrane protein n=1 Tax=Croceitalea vernalis TaxID=3075599 RepID=A0ABU3BKS3_9FLAO|nr:MULTISPECIES: CCC motif membrane protein [unclassified Croceitalea]MDT0540783.1 CCC motif membrane protein [Croceitalea sp. P059]MDT0622762.1 CCC motif membrane protein [Croceitalea sp. P007]